MSQAKRDLETLPHCSCCCAPTPDLSDGERLCKDCFAERIKAAERRKIRREREALGIFSAYPVED